ncbi:hypothetical protein Talka_00075 [Tepidimonas alkaliphilus]|uniref:DUF2062 domain-containing protein n=1 Tax=Tepidimonas alkaliphilus TaxID=2588942 RepID=A0A554WCV6_9BURK|nr:DUF2062 domain-containing protein [Tepidimonas alkaliphilus]TSE21407.1 hypothetical protein Talka_00075 [Tepidimonas alkaliphilus]
MIRRLQTLLPSRERLHQMRWLRWLGPRLHHPRLWHFSRRGLALGLALGVFFGLLIPVAQIPFAATLAVLLRAHLPAAVASTLVTNPVTFGPVYYGAYKLGQAILGRPSEQADESPPSFPDDAAHAQGSWWDALVALWDWVTDVGKPLVLGLAIVATVSAILIYVLVHGIWVLKVRWARQRRRRQRWRRTS